MRNKQVALILFLIFGLTCIIACRDHSANLTSHEEQKISKNGDVKRSVSQQLRANNHLPIDKRIKLFYSIKQDSLEYYNFENEDELTMYGYSFLWGD